MTTKLTDSQKQTIRIALAQWMGWNPINCEDDKCWIASLDACHEIELKLTQEQYNCFMWNLTWLTKDTTPFAERNTVSAKAEHRSLALYRALNLGELGD